MRRHVIALSLGIVLLFAFVMMGVSCVPKETAIPTDSIAYKSDLANYVTKADLSNSIAGYIADHPQASGGLTNAQVQSLIDNALANYQKKSELDAAIKAYLDAHPQATNVPATDVPGGTVSVITSPTSVQILGNTQLCYTAKIQNTVNQWVYVRPIITLNAASGQSPTVVSNVVVTLGGGAINLTGTGNPLSGNFQFTPILPTGDPTSSITMIPTTGGNGNSGEIQLAANTTVDVLVCITITATNNIVWNVGTSINWRSL